MGDWNGNTLELGSLVGQGENTLTLSPDERALHTYVVGTTGAGKSRFVESLIQQDIRNWPQTQAGLLFIDPDGESFDRLMGWIDERDFSAKRPILPIDFRRAREDIVAYNPLRYRPDVESQVVANNLALAIANVWGDASLDDTPRFARFARNLLHGLYCVGATFPQGDAFLDFAQASLRKAMAERIDDQRTRAVWDEINRAKEREFLEKLESTQNRFDPILGNPALRAVLGQPGHSLDLNAAVEDGHIILACVSQQGGQLDAKSQKSFVSLLLADLWQTIQQRGKATSRKPFYCYIDEFHEFISPTLPEALPRARGYGLHFILAHQFPHQLPNANPKVGERLLDEILNIVQTVITFQQRSEKDIDLLTRHLFSASFDPMKIKHVIESTKALGIEKTVLSSWGESVSTPGDTEASGSGEAVDDEGEPTGSSSFSSSSSSRPSYSSTENHSEAFTPKYGKEISSVVFAPIEEQVFAASVAIRTAPKRHAIVKRPADRLPHQIRTFTVGEEKYPPVLVERFYRHCLSAWPFALSRAEADRVLNEQRWKALGDLRVREEEAEIDMPIPKMRVVQSPNAKATED